MSKREHIYEFSIPHARCRAIVRYKVNLDWPRGQLEWRGLKDLLRSTLWTKRQGDVHVNVDRVLNSLIAAGYEFSYRLIKDETP